MVNLITVNSPLTTGSPMFIDEAKIKVKAGDGGNGCMAFRREKDVYKRQAPAVR